MTCLAAAVPAPPGGDLVAEGETIERLALRSLHDAATPDMRRDLRIDWRETPSCMASIAAALPASAIVVNRAFLGSGADLPHAAEPYRTSGVTSFFLHVPHGCPFPAARAAALGLAEARGWQKFVRLRGAALRDAPEGNGFRDGIARAFDERGEVWRPRICFGPCHNPLADGARRQAARRALRRCS